MLSALTKENKKALFDLLSLLVAIYCAAILGDYASEALVIKHHGVDALPGLFQVNAFLLFLVSAVLFKFVDRFPRWQLIRGLSLFFFVLVVVFGAIAREYAFACTVLYCMAYVSKLSLFVIFWIIANDICDTRESKAVFPTLAAGGLCGGLLSTLVAGKVIHLLHVENLVWVWAALLVLPFLLINRIRNEYEEKLRAPEPEAVRPLRVEFSEILGERAVIVMAAVYLLVFLLIFNLDFIFAKTLSEHMTSPLGFNAEKFVGFKFNVYLAATTCIILFQAVYTSSISRKFGVTNSLIILPAMLCFGFIALHVLKFRTAAGPVLSVFWFVTTFYVLRQFLFESLFSSNYQIFFSAFTRKFRGKGKLLLEGLVKPLGVAAAGLFIVSLQRSHGYFLALAFLAALLTVLIIFLKREYSRILLQEEVVLSGTGVMKLIKREISGKNKDKILSLISRAIDSQDYDLKRFSIKYLEYSGSPAAFDLLRKKFFEESDRIKELIANSLSTFDSFEARGFLRKLLEDPNAAIRAGAIRSIRKNPVLKPRRFDFNSLVYDHHPLVFEEAVLLTYPELPAESREFVQSKINEMLSAERLDERVAALHLAGRLKLWPLYERVVSHLESGSREIWKASIDAILLYDDVRSIQALVRTLDQDLDRARENMIVSALGRASLPFYPVFEERFMAAHRKRTAFSLISILRQLSARQLREKGKPIRQRAEVRQKLVEMAMTEMQKIYEDVYRYYDLRMNIPRMHKEVDLIKDAIFRKRVRFSVFVLNMLALLDGSGALLNIEKDFKFLDGRDKANIIELIEAFGDKNISRFLVPILEEYGERELLKIGSEKWPYQKGFLDEALKYFKDMDNRWMNSVASYIEERARHAA
ncbi:MAG: MFS transporter [Fibrobacterota bacterium]